MTAPARDALAAGVERRPRSRTAAARRAPLEANGPADAQRDRARELRRAPWRRARRLRSSRPLLMFLSSPNVSCEDVVDVDVRRRPRRRRRGRGRRRAAASSSSGRRDMAAQRTLAPLDGLPHHPLHGQGRRRQDLGRRGDRPALRRGRRADARRCRPIPAHSLADVLERAASAPSRPRVGAEPVGPADLRAGGARAQLGLRAGLDGRHARRARRRPDQRRGADGAARRRRAVQPARAARATTRAATSTSSSSTARRPARRCGCSRSPTSRAGGSRRSSRSRGGSSTRRGRSRAPCSTCSCPATRCSPTCRRFVENLIAMHEILRDREHVSLRLVMNPDRMVVDEARRTFTYLNLYGFLTDAVVVNRVFPDDVGAVLRRVARDAGRGADRGRGRVRARAGAARAVLRPRGARRRDARPARRRAVRRARRRRRAAQRSSRTGSSSGATARRCGWRCRSPTKGDLGLKKIGDGARRARRRAQAHDPAAPGARAGTARPERSSTTAP